MATLKEIQEKRMNINAELAKRLEKHETMQHDPYVTIQMMAHMRLQINALCDALTVLDREEAALKGEDHGTQAAG